MVSAWERAVVWMAIRSPYQAALRAAEEGRMGFLDALMPFFLGHRTEIAAAVTATANLLAVLPGVGPWVAPATHWVNILAPYAISLFAAARAARAKQTAETAQVVAVAAASSAADSAVAAADAVTPGKVVG